VLLFSRWLPVCWQTAVSANVFDWLEKNRHSNVKLLPSVDPQYFAQTGNLADGHHERFEK
jgi:hypothetical protein